MGENQILTLPAASKNWALFLDIDGTLLDIAPTPDAVVVPAGLLQVLENVSDVFGGAVAFVSGRPIPWIDRVFTPLRLPAAGQHGAEIRFSGHDTVHPTVELPDLHLLRTRVAAIAATMPGVLVEEKTFGVALHYRSAPERSVELRERLDALLAELKSDLHLLTGKMVFEIKAMAAWKERAIEIFMEVEPFLGRTPVVLGDDKTDEGGFKAALRRGGYAIQVGPGASTVATGFMQSPSVVRDWLARLPEALRGTAA